MNFKPYMPPNEGAGLLTVDRDLCWRINPRGLVTPAVIGAICWARKRPPPLLERRTASGNWPYRNHCGLPGTGAS